MAQQDRHRWFGVGTSDAEDAAEAGAAAGRGAIVGEIPKLLVVFFSSGYDAGELVTGLRAVAPDVPLIGCSTAGEIAADGSGRTGVVVTALGGEGFAVRTSAAAVGDDPRMAGRRAASGVRELRDDGHRILLVLSDGLAGDQQEIVRGLYDEVGAVIPLVGGCAGDDLAMERTIQLCGDEVLHGAVVVAAVSSDAPFGIGVRHGWQRRGEPMTVTRSADTRVLRLDDQPALDAYLERLDAPLEVREDAAAFTRYATTHPLGLARRDQESIRFISGADFEERSLQCIANVPQGGLVWLMEGDQDSVLAATDEACEQALAGLGREGPIGLLAFDCIARKDVLGGSVSQEISRITAAASGAPVAGFYTYGEIARTRGVRGFHNQTLVVLAVS